ncbi:hypothetical protein KEM60_02967 [Austwickia sp. TVS 96-490-7B]|uniref:S1C family serine protease n=1 Tax=Austwickia sp. TVS 96-490-7B TaxID=2830843 RepID=UPI001C585F69|nr:trypsin-like peptidase domain-containing protein [Austwickia sp. TVS 96-490-7B]MBW3086738.1 hypothetical protein [Austwickia sp. TVS 96-490-7B]
MDAAHTNSSTSDLTTTPVASASTTPIAPPSTPPSTAQPTDPSAARSAASPGASTPSTAPASSGAAQTPPPRRRVTLAALAVAGMLAIGGVGYGIGKAVSAPETAQASVAAAPAPRVGDTTWSAVAGKVSPSVVAIAVKGNQGGDQGSGVIWDSRGDIVTNNHVVSMAGAHPQIEVRVGAQDTYSASVVGVDPATDLAVIRLDAPPKTLVPIDHGDSAALHVGQPVMALGNPLGLSGTVTTGIVSALNRPVTTSQVPDPSNSPLMSDDSSDESAGGPPVVTDAIQTNAAINPGNSGGALVDSAGRLVGVNSAIASLGRSASTSSQSGNIGIGFAIPVHEVENIAGQLIEHGRATPGYLGIAATDATVRAGSAAVSGAGVASVAANSPAAGVGLVKGDVVTAVDGVPVDSATSLVGRIRAANPTQRITVTVHHGDQVRDVAVTLQPRPEK